MDAKDKQFNLGGAAYNLAGDVPQKYSWTYSEQSFCDMIKKYIQGIIPEFKDVTLEYNPDNGQIVTLAWIDKDCKHLVDNSLKYNNNCAVRVPVPHTSQELKNFTNRFCPKKQNKAIGALNDNKVVAFIIDPLKVIDVVFDRSGESAEKEFGVKPPSAAITVAPKFLKKGDQKFAKLEYIEITKTTSKKYGQKPKAKRNFKH